MQLIRKQTSSIVRLVALDGWWPQMPAMEIDLLSITPLLPTGVHSC